MKVSLQLTIGTPEKWQEGAACLEYPSSWWTEREGQRWNNKRARAVCSRCPVAAECLEFQLAYEASDDVMPDRSDGRTYRWGIFGGLGPAERAQVQAKRDRRALTFEGSEAQEWSEAQGIYNVEIRDELIGDGVK